MIQTLLGVTCATLPNNQCVQVSYKYIKAHGNTDYCFKMLPNWHIHNKIHTMHRKINSTVSFPNRSKVLELVRTRTGTQWVSPSPSPDLSPDLDSTLVDSDLDSTSVDSDSSAPPRWTWTQALWTRTLVSWTWTRTPPKWTRTHSESRWVRWEMHKANLNFHVNGQNKGKVLGIN